MIGEFWVHLLLSTGKANIGCEKEDDWCSVLNSSRIQNIYVFNIFSQQFPKENPN
jgi:hypothetical protein